MRAINWRATARSGALHTNEFDPTSIAAVRLLLDVGSLFKSWEAIDADLMELLCVVSASLAAAFATRGYAVGLASNASLSQELRAVDLSPAHGVLPDVLEAIARLRPFTVRDYGSVLADELAEERGEADCVLVTGGASSGGAHRARSAARRTPDDRRVRRRASGVGGPGRRLRGPGRLRLEDCECSRAPRLNVRGSPSGPSSRASGAAPSRRR